ncbi:MAG: hypothetical protein L3K09_01110 [Thermoplasmata archaeon]|nr:hypothetical protein [Thermoplasmata archaeon]
MTLDDAPTSPEGPGRGPFPVLGAVALAVIVATSSLVLAAVARSGTNGSVDSGFCAGQLSPVHLGYRGPQTGFLSDSYPGEVTPYYCEGFHLPPNAELSAGVLLHNSDPVDPHTILSVGVDPPYSTVSVSPGVPATIPAGGNLTFTVTFLLPSIGGTYDSPAASVTATW